MKTEKTTKKIKKLLLQALEKKLGNITISCAEVGCSRELYYGAMKNDPEFKKAVDELPDKQIEWVENKLLARIEAGDTQATIFYMKTKGKKAGYTETININQDIKFNFGIEDDED